MRQLLQPNVMALSGDEQLHPLQFPGMAALDSLIRGQRMIKREPEDRSADDLRRAAQMTAAQAGDRTAYEALLRNCVPLIRAIAVRRGVPADRCDDVIQDVLLTIHRARQTYDPARSFTGWLRTIAERRAIDLLRQIGRQRAREIHSPPAFESYIDEAAEAARNREHMGSRRVNEALATLPKSQREAVQVLILEEKSLAEAAAATRRTKGALKVSLHRALNALRGKFGGKD